MATKKKQTWLIISYFSGIDSLACSHHIDDRLGCLQDQGIEPILLSSLCAPHRSDIQCYRIPSLAPSGLTYEIRYLSKRIFGDNPKKRILQLPASILLLPWYGLESLLLHFECTWSWYLTAGRFAEHIARKHDIEIIYSTGGAASAHLAGLKCAQRTGTPWIAEFQDPIVGNWIKRRKSEQAYNTRLEMQVAQSADAVIYMTRTAMEEARIRTKLENNLRFIYPGAAPLTVNQIQNSDTANQKLVIGHFGSLGRDRDPKSVLDALIRLVQKHPDARSNTNLLLVGHMDTFQKAMLKDFPYPEMIDSRGKVTRAESLAWMNTCNLLLLIQNKSQEASVTIPSKAYEYLQTGLPVLGLTYNNPELQSILRNLGHAAIDHKYPEKVSKALESFYVDWKSGRLSTKEANSSPYTITSASQQLISIAEQIERSRY